MSNFQRFFRWTLMLSVLGIMFYSGNYTFSSESEANHFLASSDPYDVRGQSNHYGDQRSEHNLYDHSDWDRGNGENNYQGYPYYHGSTSTAQGYKQNYRSTPNAYYNPQFDNSPYYYNDKRSSSAGDDNTSSIPPKIDQKK